MRQSCRGTFIGTPSDDLRVLVAIDAEGYCQIHVEVRTVPKACPTDPLANMLSKPGQQPLALCTVGAGHSRPVPPGNGQSKVCSSSCGLLHQMSGG